MEVKEIFCMKSGEGENNYANAAALVTLKLGAEAQHMIEKAARSLVTEHVSPSMCLNVADIGCGFGPQPLALISTVIQSVRERCSELKQCKVPEIQFFLNDLVGNDFNTLFKELSILQQKHKDVSWFARGVPGSFHARLFPRNSLNLVYSCYSLHWLSSAPKLRDAAGLPVNKGQFFISKSSPPEVSEAYLSQFRQDFSSMLKYRSQELAPNARMVLIFNGRQYADHVDSEGCYIFELLAEAASHLVSQRLIEEEKLDSFDIPYYDPSKEEVKELLDKEDSLTTECIDTIELNIGGQNMWPKPEGRIKCYRSFSEAIVSHQFGEDVMDKLYDKATQILAEDIKLGKETSKLVSIVVMVKKKDI